MSDELRTLTAKKYDRAFSCILDSICPQTNGETGCPMWLEYADELRDDDGLLVEQRRVGGCAPVALYKINAESANRTVLALAKSEDARAAAEGVERVIHGAALMRHAALDLRTQQLSDVAPQVTLETTPGSVKELGTGQRSEEP